MLRIFEVGQRKHFVTLYGGTNTATAVQHSLEQQLLRYNNRAVTTATITVYLSSTGDTKPH